LLIKAAGGIAEPELKSRSKNRSFKYYNLLHENKSFDECYTGMEILVSPNFFFFQYNY
jgi:hypothetical protein